MAFAAPSAQAAAPNKASPEACRGTKPKQVGDTTRHTLKLEKPGDACGAVYWIGSRGREVEYANAGKQGVRVRASSVAETSKKPRALLNRKPARFITQAEKRPWVEVDFRKTRIQPSHYTLRHPKAFAGQALRTWKLLGSVDGKSWTVIRTHKDDKTLSKKGARGVWKLDADKFPEGFSKFRILMDGPNSSDTMELAVSEFEVYGNLFEAGAGKQDKPPAPKQDSAPAPGAITLTHQSDFDQNGAIYYLGSLGKTKPFDNPVDLGRMKVRASSLMHDSQPAKALLDRSLIRFTTKQQPGAWVEFDFLDERIAPTAYTLKHYKSWDTEALRNWVLEGSNDGSAWTTLHTHNNDGALKKIGGTKTWSILGNAGPFRFLRIRTTGKNSNGHYYLALSGVEFYGSLGATAKPKAPAQFEYVSDFDNNGILYHLGTNQGTAPFQNAAGRDAVDVTASSLRKDSEPASALLDRTDVRFTTHPIKNSSVRFDFKGRRVKVRAYTLKHYKSFDTEALRSWVLEGSNDGNTWTVLREHANDDALKYKGDSHTWAVHSNAANTAYRYLRVRITGPNSNNHWHLALGGFEVYGDLQ